MRSYQFRLQRVHESIYADDKKMSKITEIKKIEETEFKLIKLMSKLSIESQTQNSLQSENKSHLNQSFNAGGGGCLLEFISFFSFNF